MIDTISEDAIIAPQRKTFQNSPIDCFFYTIAPPNKGEMKSELRSFSSFTGEFKKHDDVKFTPGVSLTSFVIFSEIYRQMFP